MRPINTYYNGRFFRSRLEAKWAVFFDTCGVQWEYEPEGYCLDDGSCYLPDFLLHNVTFNHGGYVAGKDLYVEVKGRMNEESANKIKQFAKYNPILVVGDVPIGDTMSELCESMRKAPEDFDISPYNFELIDDDYFLAYPGVDKKGVFNLFGDDSNYLCHADELRTVNAYLRARTVRFEEGDKIIQITRLN